MKDLYHGSKNLIKVKEFGKVQKMLSQILAANVYTLASQTISYFQLQ